MAFSKRRTIGKLGIQFGRQPSYLFLKRLITA